MTRPQWQNIAHATKHNTNIFKNQSSHFKFSIHFFLFSIANIYFNYVIIFRVIENLEIEMKKTRDEAEKNFDLRINRLCNKHNNEIEEMVKEIEQLKVNRWDSGKCHV